MRQKEVFPIAFHFLFFLNIHKKLSMFCPRLFAVRIRKLSKFFLSLVNDGFQNNATCNVELAEMLFMKSEKTGIGKRRSYCDVFV